MESKLYRFVSAVAVSIAAFFELCFTGQAERSWKLARLDYSALSQLGPGAATAEITPKPRPGIIISRKGAGATPPAPALHISRMIRIGKYTAMTIFLAFVITAFVSCPDGRSLDDGNIGTAQSAAMATGTEAPSSISAITAGTVCVLISITIAAAAILRRESDSYGKEGKGHRGQD